MAWSLFGFSKIYNKDTSTTAQILALDKNKIAAFNRRAVDHYSQTAFDNSNLFFYGSMPLPLLLLFDKPARKDAVKLGLLYLEAMGITGILYTSAAYFHDKYRPYAYNPEAPFDRRKRGGRKEFVFLQDMWHWSEHRRFLWRPCFPATTRIRNLIGCGIRSPAMRRLPRLTCAIKPASTFQRTS